MSQLEDIVSENLLLEFADKNLDARGLVEKRKEVLALIAANTQKKVIEKCVRLFDWIQNGGQLNNVIDRTIKLLVRDGYLTFGNKGNLYQDLLLKPYTEGTANAQAAQMSSMLPMLKIVINEGNDRYVPNPNSLLLMKLNAKLGRITEQRPTEMDKSTMTSQKNDNFSPPLNQILYGPPGTGKTYSVVLKAMSIVDGIDYSSEVSKSDYANLKSRYDELCMKGQIAFVTFHQSYGYEDFIEGIRPRTDGQMISYEVRDGILKTIALRAMKNWLKAAEIHKNSIDDVDMFEKSFQLFEEALEESHDGKEKITLYRGGAAELEMGAMGRSVVVSLPGYKTTFNLPKSQLKKLWVRREEIKRPADTKLYNSSFFWAVLEHLKSIAIKVTKTPPQAIEQEELKPFFLVIDEINRGNISKIFGELITLIEDDKRIGAPYEMRVTLPYSQEDEDPFGLPPNLYILGTMNTSDRSIALLDTALRRRFEFEEIRPDPSTLRGIEVEGGINLPEMLSAMNERIEYLYDRDHTIGHAYFINVKSLSDMETVFRRKIIPLLQEYFYEDWAKVRLALNDKDGSFIEEKNDIPKGLESFVDGYGSKSRYIVRDKFTVDAYRKIYA